MIVNLCIGMVAVFAAAFIITRYAPFLILLFSSVNALVGAAFSQPAVNVGVIFFASVFLLSIIAVVIALSIVRKRRK